MLENGSASAQKVFEQSGGTIHTKLAPLLKVHYGSDERLKSRSVMVSGYILLNIHECLPRLFRGEY